MSFKKRIGKSVRIGGIVIVIALGVNLVYPQVLNWILHQDSNAKKNALALSPQCSVALVPHVGSNARDREISRIQKRLQTEESTKDYLDRLGWAYIAKARFDYDPSFYNLAQATAGCISKIAPDAPSALLLKTHVYNNQNKFKKAEKVGRVLTSKRGAWFDYAVYGDALLEQGKLDQAIAAYQKMMNLRPGPQAYLRVAHVRWLTGDLTGAIELLRMAVPAVSRKDTESAAWVNVRLAFYLNQAGQIGESKSLLEKALVLKKDYPPALLELGRIYLAENRIEEAVLSLRKAVDGNPLPEYQWAFIEALQAGSHSSELDRQQVALRTRGPATDLRTFTLYMATTGQGDSTLMDLAEREINKRGDVLTLDTMAWVLYTQGEFKKAFEFTKKAMVHGTRDARLFFHWGTIAAANQKYEEAQRWLNCISLDKT